MPEFPPAISLQSTKRDKEVSKHDECYYNRRQTPDLVAEIRID